MYNRESIERRRESPSRYASGIKGGQFSLLSLPYVRSVSKPIRGVPEDLVRSRSRRDSLKERGEHVVVVVEVGAWVHRKVVEGG